MSKKHIESLLKKLPNSPGVYKFKDEDGRVLYVGKAKNLNKRVRSYFRKEQNRPVRTKKLLENISDIEWTEVGSDLEALFLETNLIKEYKPKYNVLMKDDKNFVYIKITKNEDFPRIKIVRKVERDGARYFGPKTAANKVKQTLMLLQKLFLFRSCDLGIAWEGDGKVKISNKTIAYPCLDFHIKRCAGPCIAKISKDEYAEAIGKVEYFLEGKTEEIEKIITDQMSEAVAAKDFEKAALLRDKLLAIKDLMQKQLVSSPDHENIDIFGFVLDSGKAYFNLFGIRDGKMIIQENFIADAQGFEAGDEENAPEVVESFLFQYYERATDIPKSVLIPIEIDEHEFFESWISNQIGNSLKFIVPVRGKKNKLIELSRKNAESFMKQYRARWAGFEKRDEDAISDLCKVLGLDKKLKRIECYDISHLGGTDTVASMVVFEMGVPKKSDYRKFSMRKIIDGEIDDFKSMKEVISRRLAYLSMNRKDVTIRKATKSKKKDIEKLLIEWRGELGDFGEIDQYFTANVDKKVVGLVRLISSDDLFLLRSLYVSPEYRSKGIARALIRYAIDKTKAKRIYLSCLENMTGFYESVGFESIKTFPNEFINEYEAFKMANKGKNIAIFAYSPSKNKDTSFDTRPDLILIDGGKGQLNAALSVVENLGLDIPVISLAKKHEDVYLPGKKDPLLLPNESEALKLLIRIRDEAHRFAISFQKKKREKSIKESKLDLINGLGDVGKMKLLQYFGSVEKIKLATEEELASVVGESLARKILEDL